MSFELHVAIVTGAAGASYMLEQYRHWHEDDR